MIKLKKKLFSLQTFFFQVKKMKIVKRNQKRSALTHPSIKLVDATFPDDLGEFIYYLDLKGRVRHPTETYDLNLRVYQKNEQEMN